MTSEGDSQYLQELMLNLVGFTITKIGDPDEDGFFDIHLKHPVFKDCYKLTPSCDPEGNAPGFLFIEEVINDVPENDTTPG